LGCANPIRIRVTQRRADGSWMTCDARSVVRPGTRGIGPLVTPGPGPGVIGSVGVLFGPGVAAADTAVTRWSVGAPAAVEPAPSNTTMPRIAVPALLTRMLAPFAANTASAPR
jgi:hypothetical protein